MKPPTGSLNAKYDVTIGGQTRKEEGIPARVGWLVADRFSSFDFECDTTRQNKNDTAKRVDCDIKGFCQNELR